MLCVRQCERLHLHSEHFHLPHTWATAVAIGLRGFLNAVVHSDSLTSAVLCARQVQADTSVLDGLPLLLQSADRTSLVLTTGRVIGAAVSMAGLLCSLQCRHCLQLCIIAMRC